MTAEEWRAVPGREGYYEVSSHGRVRSLPRTITTKARVTQHLAGVILSAATSKDGRAHVVLCQNGVGKNTKIHLLVLAAFVGPRPEGMEACHNDGNRANNHVENLRWDTHSANMLDRITHGTCPNTMKTRCPQGHPYDEENTAVRNGGRSCRTCQREASRRHYIKVLARRSGASA